MKLVGKKRAARCDAEGEEDDDDEDDDEEDDEEEDDEHDDEFDLTERERLFVSD